MTPPERANFLVNQLSLPQAIDHVNWVIAGCKKEVTKQYWEMVREELIKRNENHESSGSL